MGFRHSLELSRNIVIRREGHEPRRQKLIDETQKGFPSSTCLADSMPVFDVKQDKIRVFSIEKSTLVE